MSFWNLFRTKRPKIHDAFFGELVFMEEPPPDQSYLLGQRNFRPIAEEVEVLIDGDLTVPAQQQKEFFKWIEANYWSLLARIGPFVEQEFMKQDPAFRLPDFTEKFDLSFLKIPFCSQSPIEWEIGFDSNSNLRGVIYSLTVVMLNEQPVDSGVSC